MGYKKWWVTNDRAEEFLFRDLFEVGEVEFGEEVLMVQTVSAEISWQKCK